MRSGGGGGARRHQAVEGGVNRRGVARRARGGERRGSKLNTVKKPGATLVDATAGDAVRGWVSAERRDVAGGGSRHGDCVCDVAKVVINPSSTPYNCLDFRN